jgi:hypothetical protein
MTTPGHTRQLKEQALVFSGWQGRNDAVQIFNTGFL